MGSKLYGGVRKIISIYWDAYEGWFALVRSPYVHLSIFFCIVCVGFWFESDWTGQALQVLPNLLGFTLGGFAVFLGFGDEKFRQTISGKRVNTAVIRKVSPYLSVSATFLHFVLVQVIALTWAIVAAAMHSFHMPVPEAFETPFFALRVLGDGLGYWLFLYSIFSAAAAALAVFRAAWWFDEWQGTKQKALVKCEDCGEEVSSRASICPKCGAPSPTVPRTP